MAIPVRQMVKDAVSALGGTATNRQIIDWIKSKHGDVNERTIRAQTIACAVNQPSRVWYAENNKARKDDSRYDVLFSIGKGEVTLYNPDVHGKWEIVLDKGKPKIAKDGKVISSNPDEEEFFFTKKDFESRTGKKEDAKYLADKFKILLNILKQKLPSEFEDSKSYYSLPNNRPDRTGKLTWKDHMWLGFATKDAIVNRPQESIQFQTSLTPEGFVNCDIWISFVGRKQIESALINIKKNQAQFIEILKKLPDNSTIAVYERDTDNEVSYNTSSISNDELNKIINELGKPNSEIHLGQIWTQEEAINLGTGVVDEIVNTFTKLIPSYKFLNGLSTQIKEDYFIFRTSMESRYEDREGVQYHYNNRVPNYTKIHPGANVVLQRRSGNDFFFLGYGKIASIDEESSQDEEGKSITDYKVKFSNYHKFEPAKPRTAEVYAQMQRNLGFNNQHSISQITKNLFNVITGMETMSATEQSEFVKYADILQKKNQLIFYGPPGTGKTFTANKFANWFVSSNTGEGRTKEIQSMSDEEFNNYVVEKIRNLSKAQNYELIKEPGSFNLYSLRSSFNDIRLVFVFSKSGKNVKNDVWIGVGTNVLKFLNEVPPENRFRVLVNNDTKSFVILPYEIEQKYARFNLESGKDPLENTTEEYNFHVTINENDSKLLTRDKTYEDKYYDCTKYLNNLETLGIGEEITPKEFVRHVTFHPSYSYEEFVEGIKPKAREAGLEFSIEDGIFKKICKDATEDPDNKYVLVIDEINRGNIAKILGELITLVENDKRGTHSLSLTYSQEKFTVPENVYLIGTMNTADRSLTQLDVALRRRFGFCELMPDYSIINGTIEEISLPILLENLNKKIRQYEGREKQIGHSYFMLNGVPLQTIDDLQFVFANEIIPLLQDYFYEDYDKLQQVLGNEFVDVKNMEIKSDWKEDKNVFKNAIKKFVTND